MKIYTISKADGKPDWGCVPALHVDTVLWAPDCGIRMTQQLCYDETAFYVRQQAKEPIIRAEHFTPLSPVCEDSYMEFFFSLGADDRYFNFEINPNACFEIGFGLYRENRIRICHKTEHEAFHPVCKRTLDGWTAEYRIPIEFLRLFYPAYQLEPGVRFRANCYKCGDLTVHQHYLSWNPVETRTPDFHRPEFFGQMLLE